MLTLTRLACKAATSEHTKLASLQGCNMTLIPLQLCQLQAGGQDSGTALTRGSTMLPPVAALPGPSSSAVLHTAPSSSSIVATTTGCASAPAGESRHPQQVTACTGSSEFSNPGVQPLLDGSSGLLPVGTIIMPANDNLPPGSLVLPQGSLPGGQLRLALPGQLPLLQPEPALSHPLSRLHASAAAAQASLQDATAVLMAKVAPTHQNGATHCVSRKAQATSCAAARCSAQAAAHQPLQRVPRRQSPHSNLQGGPEGAPVPGRGQRPYGAAAKLYSTAGNDLEIDAVSVTASEGTSMLGGLLLLQQAACTHSVCLVPQRWQAGLHHDDSCNMRLLYPKRRRLMELSFVCGALIRSG